MLQAVSDIVRTTLGPKSMLKMLLDPMGGIVITNDGNAILREIDVAHPAAKSMLELSRSQDEEVGDGTTSVIILAGELLAVSEPFLAREIHPTVIVNAYHKALDFALQTMEKLAVQVRPPACEAVILSRGLESSCVVFDCYGCSGWRIWGLARKSQPSMFRGFYGFVSMWLTRASRFCQAAPAKEAALGVKSHLRCGRQQDLLILCKLPRSWFHLLDRYGLN